MAAFWNEVDDGVFRRREKAEWNGYALTLQRFPLGFVLNGQRDDVVSLLTVGKWQIADELDFRLLPSGHFTGLLVSDLGSIEDMHDLAGNLEHAHSSPDSQVLSWTVLILLSSTAT
jgi:hypothetical protein